MERRPLEESDLDAYAALQRRVYGPIDGPPHAPAWDRQHLDRSVGVFDEGELVAVARSIPLEITLPGPRTAVTAGLSSVAVAPTHRRRGLLRAMLDDLAIDWRRRGEALSTLLASEAGIYGRFG